MKNKKADIFKAMFSIRHQYEDALKVLSRKELSGALTLLDTIQKALEQSISDYALDLTHDLLDDETPQIVRTFWFSKGLNAYYLCIDGTGLIRAIEGKVPHQLFDQITSVLVPFYE